jgi:fatty-acyl-CoA synthase
MNPIFSTGLNKCPANHVPLSPLSFLKRTASIYPERPAVIYGRLRRTYQELLDRCLRAAAYLKSLGVERGTAVSVMLPNVPEMVELHFAIGAAGGVMHSINTRLDAEAIRFQVAHCEARVLIFDREYGALIKQVISGLEHDVIAVEVVDPTQEYAPQDFGQHSYEEGLALAHPLATLGGPADEWDPVAVSYTSGTTGNPKGVVTHHRGAYLNSMANSVAWAMGNHPVYLWTLPLFHCNGWCFPWTVTLLAGTHVCLRRIDLREIFRLVELHGVTHFCAAPVVLTMLAEAPDDIRQPFPHRVRVLTAGSAPSSTTIRAMEALNADVLQVYGLTETYSSAVLSAWKEEWNGLGDSERYRLKARTGVRYPACEGLDVVDASGTPVPRDGKSLGEVVIWGNTVMSGYLKNAAATEEAFDGGWFHTGDIAVMDPDGYISIRDRSKDVIISGGENISSVEVEEVISRHSAVLEVAVVAMPDAKWDEVPCAFVSIKRECSATEEELINFCKLHLAKFKVPKRIFFGPIERTATGKVQKFKLRQIASAEAAEAVPAR